MTLRFPLSDDASRVLASDRWGTVLYGHDHNWMWHLAPSDDVSKRRVTVRPGTRTLCGKGEKGGLISWEPTKGQECEECVQRAVKQLGPPERRSKPERPSEHAGATSPSMRSTAYSKPSRERFERTKGGLLISAGCLMTIALTLIAGLAGVLVWGLLVAVGIPQGLALVVGVAVMFFIWLRPLWNA